MKNKLVRFSDFINPNGDYDFFKDKKISVMGLDYCSYVKYLFISHINGEIDYNCFVFDFDYDTKSIFCDLYSKGCYVIYAINFLDNIVCEVI